MAADDEENALKVQENLKSAVANLWPKPFDLGVAAGTVACPQCHGSPRIRRLTPDFARALNLGDKWDFQIAKRMGRMLAFGRQPRQFLEYPGAAPVPVELPASKPEKSATQQDKAGAEDEAGFKMSHTSAFSLDDYVLNYASDDDEEPSK